MKVIENFIEFCYSKNTLVFDEVNLADALILEYQKPEDGKPVSTSWIKRVINLAWRFVGVKFMLSRFQVREKRANILFFSTDITHFNQQFPVEKLFRAYGESTLFLTTKYPLIKTIKNRGFRVASVHSNLRNRVTVWAKRKTAVKQHLGDARLWLEREADASAAEAIVKIVNDRWIDILSLQFEMLGALENRQPKAVFIGNDLTTEGRLLALCCVALGIKSYSMTHGLIELNQFYKYVRVHRFFCWGSHDRNILLKHGVEPSRVAVTGSAFLDEKNNDSANYFEDLQIESFLFPFRGRFKSLITLSGRGHLTSATHHAAIIESLRLLAIDNPDDAFIFKLHSKDRLEYYSHLEELSNVKLVHRSNSKLDQEIDRWLTYVDAVITGASTTAIDAMARERVVLTVDLIEEYSHIEFMARSIALHSRSVEELKSNFRKLKSDSSIRGNQIVKQNLFVQEYFQRETIPSAQKIRNAVLEDLRMPGTKEDTKLYIYRPNARR
jgi:hypothetical protein